MRRFRAAAGALVAAATMNAVCGMPASGSAPDLAPHAAGHIVIGHGSPRGCTSAAVVRAVAKGGWISFDCGPEPVTIVMRHTAKVENTSRKVVIDGGGTVTLSGGGKRQILYQNTCDQAQTWTTSHCQDQRWPKLVIKNITFTRGNARAPQHNAKAFGGGGGGGAIFAEGGQLVVTNSRFIRNRCRRNGPDLGGAAIRARQQWHREPVTIVHDVFRGGRCSNGSALSSIAASWLVRDTVMKHNRAIGHGANPAKPGTPGGGSGGAIYTDGTTYTVKLVHTTIAQNWAREGGGAVFFVSNDGTGTMTIKHSTLHHNPSRAFETAGYPGIFFKSGKHHPKVVHSTLD
jgi:hypothetical protein